MGALSPAFASPSMVDVAGSGPWLAAWTPSSHVKCGEVRTYATLWENGRRDVSTVAVAVAVAVAGGGIGGLTLSVALRRHGAVAEVFERAAVLGQVGTAISLTTNSVRLLARLGLGKSWTACRWSPTEVIYRVGGPGTGPPRTRLARSIGPKRADQPGAMSIRCR
jgi:hypothetical protein